MDKNTVKGTIDDAAGRAKRQLGEWTGDVNAQASGAAQQVKGKMEKAAGAVRDAAHKVAEEARRRVQQDEKRRAEQAEEQSNNDGPHAYSGNRHSA